MIDISYENIRDLSSGVFSKKLMLQFDRTHSNYLWFCLLRYSVKRLGRSPSQVLTPDGGCCLSSFSLLFPRATKKLCKFALQQMLHQFITFQLNNYPFQFVKPVFYFSQQFCILGFLVIQPGHLQQLIFYPHPVRDSTKEYCSC